MLKNSIFLAALIHLLLFMPEVHAAEKKIDATSETILRTFERQDETNKSNRLFPVYEYLSMDYGKPLDSGFTFHAHGWGRHEKFYFAVAFTQPV